MSATPKKVVLLGCTGSIGTSSLKVASDIPERMQLIGLAANRSAAPVIQQVTETGVRHVAMWDEEAAETVSKAVDDGVTVRAGEAGLVELAQLPEADMVIIAIIGTAGLRPALAAIDRASVEINEAMAQLAAVQGALYRG